MTLVRIENESRATTLGERVRVADGWWSRLRGMLGRPAPERGEGLLLVPCRGVHMWGMRYPLDVVMMDAERRVIELYEELAPWCRTRVHRDARFALELPAGTIRGTGTTTGDRLRWNGAGRRG